MALTLLAAHRDAVSARQMVQADGTADTWRRSGAWGEGVGSALLPEHLHQRDQRRSH